MRGFSDPLFLCILISSATNRMSNKEIKGNLARLLATENLVVEHRNCPTASFDVNNRVLTLPKWDKASNVVYDLLVGHEVGHALHTPKWDSFACPIDYVNVTEDARVEKLMKRRYPGLRKTFFNGYTELKDQDFFGIGDDDVSAYKLIDRINLYFKIGSAGVDIPFDEEEIALVKETERAETFEEAVAIAEKIWEFSKEQQNKLEKMANVEESGGDGGSSSSENNSSTSTEKTSDQSDEKGDQSSTSGDSSDSEEDEDGENDEQPVDSSAGDIGSSDTQRSFDSATENLNSKHFNRNPLYIDIPTIKTKDFVVDWKVIHDWIDLNKSESDDHYEIADNDYKKFKKTIVKEVNYLVKEFECKKAAEAYSRSMNSRTGVLDCTKLHTFKYNEDLFKKVTIIPEGKNHGMLFILDWSGSMGNVMLPTLKQLMTLCIFCKKVGIPFEVYAFTNEWAAAERAMSNDSSLSNDYDDILSDVKENTVYLSGKYFRMMNIISSRSNSREFEHQCLNIWREVFTFRYWTAYSTTIGMDLSGTPLNESILVMKDIIPEYKKMTNVSKINLCILTDGDACGSAYGYKSFSGKIVGRRIDSDSITIRDRKIGRVYSMKHMESSLTNLFLENLKENNPDVNVIGFRILESSGLNSFYSRYCHFNYSDRENMQKEWRKKKSAILPNPISYDALYAIRSNDVSNEENPMEVSDNATKTEVKNAFKKMLSVKQSNKTILNSFISLIA